MMRKIAESGEFVFTPEPGEQLYGQYRTHGLAMRGKPFGQAGMLLITNTRVVFYKKEGILKQLVKTETPSYSIVLSIPLTQVIKIASKGGSYPAVRINGAHYYVEDATPRQVVKVLKELLKPIKKQKKGKQAPVVTPIVASQPAPAGPPTKRFCTSCGLENKVDAKYCAGCGAAL